MSAMEHSQELYTQAQRVFEELKCLSVKFDHASDAFGITRVQQDTIQDDLERFKLWAGNLGVFNPASDRRSLEHRLRNAPHVKNRLRELLTELLELLYHPVPDDESSLNTSSGDSDQSDFNEDKDLAFEILGLKTSAECQGTWWYASISDTIGRLFKVSKMVNKATTRNRHVRAEASVDVAFDDAYDIGHVLHKFERLRVKPWLLHRLGECNTKRRNYFRYCRTHREKLEERGLHYLHDTEPTARTPNVPHSRHTSIPKTSAESTESKQSNGQTTASTLGPVDLNAIDDGFDDAQSVSTVANSLFEERDSRALSVPRFTDIAQPGIEFECPYCFTIQRFNGQRAWKTHLFADLQPYVFTFAECHLVMFADRRTWEDHEMQVHRRYWQCRLCYRQHFETSSDLKEHVLQKHADIARTEQLVVFLEACSQPMENIVASDCDFCNWTVKLRGLKENSDIPKDSEIHVVAHQFMRHLASHLEQLALFALPRNSFPDEDSAMAGIGTKSSGNSSRMLVLLIRLMELDYSFKLTKGSPILPIPGTRAPPASLKMFWTPRLLFN